VTKPAYRHFTVDVASIDRMSPSFTRVTFASDDLADVGWSGPDQRIKVLLPLPRIGYSSLPRGDVDFFTAWRQLPEQSRNPMRTYTIRRADPAARELVVDFVVHGDAGPASRWVRQAAVGEQVVVIAPDATSPEDAGGYEWRPGNATLLLLAGDETAVPAISSIVESLAADVRGAVFLEVPTGDDVLPLSAPADVVVTWLPRDGEGGGYGELLDRAVRAWAGEWTAASGWPVEEGADLPDADPDLLWEAPQAPDGSGLYAWLAGESSTIVGLRRHLVRDLGIDRSRIAFMGYWRLGRAEN
jgi:NADPH-dependent ferric siderophore reductase